MSPAKTRSRKPAIKEEYRRLGDLKPNDYNAHRMPDKKHGVLVQHIQRDGRLVSSLLIRSDGTIVDGEQRWRAAVEALGEDAEAHCFVVSKEAERRYRERTLAMNNLVGVDDEDALSKLLADLAGFDVTDSLAGFEVDTDLLAATGYETEEILESLARVARRDEGEQSRDRKIFADEQIVEAAFRYFREKGFPYRHLPVHICMQELNRLARVSQQDAANSVLGYQIADTYHPQRFAAAAIGMKSFLDVFASDEAIRKTLLFCLKEGEQITEELWSLQTASGCQPCWNFRPALAMSYYRRFCKQGDTVLDSSAGYGGRLVGFIASGIAGLYIGIDPSIESHEGNQRMAEDLGFVKHVKLINIPIEDVPIKRIRDRCDFAFTSPPFFKKEIYSDDPMQCTSRYKEADAWRACFLRPMLKAQFAALKRGKHSVVNIADVKIGSKVYPLEAWTAEDAEAIGFKCIDREQRQFSRVPYKRQDSGESVTGSSFFIFYKP